MPPLPTLSARDQRILAGYRAGATMPDLALVEEVDSQVICRVVRAAGIAPRMANAPPCPFVAT